MDMLILLVLVGVWTYSQWMLVKTLCDIQDRLDRLENEENEEKDEG